MARRRPVEPGLTDRSERPTTHAGFAPMEEEKQREQDEFVRRASEEPPRRGRRRRLP